MIKKICYISGPMTGIDDFNRPAFFAAAEILTDVYTVLNPATLPDGLDYDDYMRIDLAMVSVADTLILLPGWEKSKGANLELENYLSYGRRDVYGLKNGELVTYLGREKNAE